MKTPKEMAEEYAELMSFDVRGHQRGFLAGYQAAKEEYKIAIDTYNDVAKQMLEEAVRIMSPKNQLADAGKVMCNTTMEEIKAVDTGELMPITNLPTSAKWISVKERLPDNALEVIAISNGKSTAFLHKLAYCRWIIDETITHWMPLPELPKEEK